MSTIDDFFDQTPTPSGQHAFPAQSVAPQGQPYAPVPPPAPAPAAESLGQDSEAGGRRARRGAPRRSRGNAPAPQPSPRAAFVAGSRLVPVSERPGAWIRPTSVIAKRKRLAAQRHAVQVMIAGVAVVGVATVGSWFLDHQAESAAATAAAAQTAAQARVTQLQPIAAYYDGIQTRRDAVTAALSQDTNVSGVVDAVFAAAKNAGHGVTVSGFTFGGMGSCPGQNPFNPAPVLGCLTVGVTGASATDVAALVAALDADPSGLLTSAFATSYAAGGDANAANAVTVNYTTKALTLKYVPQESQAAVLASANAAALNPATGQPGASASTAPVATPSAPMTQTPGGAQ